MTWLDLLVLLLLVVWCAWWLGSVNWSKFWPILSQGAWVPGVLLALVTAAVWTKLQPGNYERLGFVTLSNGWWQTGGVALLAALALFCGWLQGYFGWLPREVPVEPPAEVEGHAHGHAHGHH